MELGSRLRCLPRRGSCSAHNAITPLSQPSFAIAWVLRLHQRSRQINYAGCDLICWLADHVKCFQNCVNRHQEQRSRIASAPESRLLPPFLPKTPITHAQHSGTCFPDVHEANHIARNSCFFERPSHSAVRLRNVWVCFQDDSLSVFRDLQVGYRKRREEPKDFNTKRPKSDADQEQDKTSEYKSAVLEAHVGLAVAP